VRWGAALWVGGLVGVLVTACGSAALPRATGPDSTGPTVRVLLAGDVMLGRGVARQTAADPAAALVGVGDQVRASDLAIANLESALTRRAHEPASGPQTLEADPPSAALLARAGFDALAIANNHAGDAGPDTVTDTVAALAAAGLVTVGGGASETSAFGARVIDVRGVRVALLAVDTTGRGPRPTATRPGVAWWDEDRVRASVTDARARADVVLVGLHGGVEYVTAADPYLTRLADQLARWGVDVVWGHGPHVVQPVTTIDPDGDGRRTVVATSLGNLVFDQHLPDTRRGAVLEVLVGRDGVRALRLGDTTIDAGRASFSAWREPAPLAEAALLGDGWWQLVASTSPAPAVRPDSATLARLEEQIAPGVLLASSIGDVDGDGAAEVVAAFRRPYRRTAVSTLVPRERLVDRHGRSAHVGVYRLADLSQRWVAGTVIHPVAALATCDGSLAVALSTLEDPSTAVAVGAWRWGGFGFVTYPELTGAGTPACADVDRDGSLDPLVRERTTP